MQVPRHGEGPQQRRGFTLRRWSVVAPFVLSNAMDFTSDNTAGASEAILEAILAANDGLRPAYGDDSFSAAAAELLREVFETDLSVFLVATGTAANALALAALCPPWGAVFCHETAHVMDDECGAPEMFTGGAKLIGVEGRGGKIARGRRSPPR